MTFLSFLITEFKPYILLNAKLMRKRVSFEAYIFLSKKTFHFPNPWRQCFKRWKSMCDTFSNPSPLRVSRIILMTPKWMLPHIPSKSWHEEGEREATKKWSQLTWNWPEKGDFYFYLSVSFHLISNTLYLAFEFFKQSEILQHYRWNNIVPDSLSNNSTSAYMCHK